MLLEVSLLQLDERQHARLGQGSWEASPLWPPPCLLVTLFPTVPNPAQRPHAGADPEPGQSGFSHPAVFQFPEVLMTPGYRETHSLVKQNLSPWAALPVWRGGHWETPVQSICTFYNVDGLDLC